jgi:hypothetical protein
LSSTGIRYVTAAPQARQYWILARSVNSMAPQFSGGIMVARTAKERAR